MSFKLLFASGLLLATVITFLSENIILGIYGSEYYGSVAALQVLVWATSVMFVNRLISSTYTASGNQNIIAKISAFATLFNSGLNLALIPLYSYTGASIATLITEFLVMIYGIHWIDRELIHKNLYKEIISPLVEGLYNLDFHANIKKLRKRGSSGNSISSNIHRNTLQYRMGGL